MTAQEFIHALEQLKGRSLATQWRAGIMGAMARAQALKQDRRELLRDFGVTVLVDRGERPPPRKYMFAFYFRAPKKNSEPYEWTLSVPEETPFEETERLVFQFIDKSVADMARMVGA